MAGLGQFRAGQTVGAAGVEDEGPGQRGVADGQGAAPLSRRPEDGRLEVEGASHEAPALAGETRLRERPMETERTSDPIEQGEARPPLAPGLASLAGVLEALGDQRARRGLALGVPEPAEGRAGEEVPCERCCRVPATSEKQALQPVHPGQDVKVRSLLRDGLEPTQLGERGRWLRAQNTVVDDRLPRTVDIGAAALVEEAEGFTKQRAGGPRDVVPAHGLLVGEVAEGLGARRITRGCRGRGVERESRVSRQGIPRAPEDQLANGSCALTEDQRIRTPR